MENVSHDEMVGETLHPRMPDGTIVVLRRFAFPSKKHSPACVLFIPDPFIKQSYDALLLNCAQLIADRKTTTYVLQPRGTDGSEGFWSLAAHERDILDWLDLLRKAHRRVIVVAQGLSASILLSLESRPQALAGNLPDGVLLISPIADASRIAAHNLFSRSFGALSSNLGASMRTGASKKGSIVHLGRARLLAREAPEVLARLDAFRLSPVRLQTPSIVLLAPDHEHVAKLLFGSVRTVHPQWLFSHDTQSNVQTMARASELASLTRELLFGESPIRFGK